MTEEKRIYVVVAETVQTKEKGTVIQPCGRIAAQCAHVVSKMHLSELSQKNMRKVINSGITTIVLAAPDSAEMERLRGGGFALHSFFDTNPEVYGPGRVLTALCTSPRRPSTLKGALEHLPLWSHDQTVAREKNPPEIGSEGFKLTMEHYRVAPLRHDDNDLITVCVNCSQASCWAGISMRDGAKTANIKQITKREARLLGLENEDYIQRPEVQFCLS